MCIEFSWANLSILNSMCKQSKSYYFLLEKAVSVFTVVVFLYSGTATVSASEEVTPLEVFLLTETLKAHLLDLKVISPEKIATFDDADDLRHPRHVIQKVKECHTILSKFLIRKGVSPAALPLDELLREVKPSDVKYGVEHLIQEVKKVGTVSEVVLHKKSGILPIDVFNNLRKICGAIDVEIFASDIFQVATAVLLNTHQIAKVRDIEIPSLSKRVTLSKSPREVFEITINLLRNLRQLSLYADYAIPGGIILSEVAPSDSGWERTILSALYDALAETSAIKYSLHVREKVTSPDYIENKTLTDVYKKVYFADVIVRKLVEIEALKQKETGLK